MEVHCPWVCTECSELVSNGMFAIIGQPMRDECMRMHVCGPVTKGRTCTRTCMCVCVCAKLVVVIKDGGNVAVDLKLMMCSSGYCLWSDVIEIDTHTYKHTWQTKIFLL